ncbi:MAG: hypothetical protein ACKO37_06155 [Vampirovibrionales bacterium]
MPKSSPLLYPPCMTRHGLGHDVARIALVSLFMSLGMLLVSAEAFANPETLQTLRLIDAPDATHILVDTPRVLHYTVLNQSATQTDIIIEGVHPSKTLQVDVALTQRVAKIQAKKLPNGSLRIHLEGKQLPKTTLVGFVPAPSTTLGSSATSQNAQNAQPVMALPEELSGITDTAQTPNALNEPAPHINKATATAPKTSSPTAQALLGVSELEAPSIKEEAPTAALPSTPTSSLQKVATHPSQNHDTPTDVLDPLKTLMQSPEVMAVLPSVLGLLGIGLLGAAGLWWIKRQPSGKHTHPHDALAMLQQLNQGHPPHDHAFAQAMAQQGWEPDALLHPEPSSHATPALEAYTASGFQAHYAQEAYRQEVIPSKASSSKKSGLQGVQSTKKEPRKLGGLTQLAKQRAEARKKSHQADETYVSDIFAKLETSMPSPAMASPSVRQSSKTSSTTYASTLAERSLYQSASPLGSKTSHNRDVMPSPVAMEAQGQRFLPEKVNPHALQEGERLIRQPKRKLAKPEPLGEGTPTPSPDSIPTLQAHLEKTHAINHRVQQHMPQEASPQRGLPQLPIVAEPERLSPQARAMKLRAKLRP